LSQAVEGLIRISILQPVLSKRAEVVIERAVFLSHEDDVIDLLKPLNCRRRINWLCILSKRYTRRNAHVVRENQRLSP
jgi:hypothetical protein